MRYIATFLYYMDSIAVVMVSLLYPIHYWWLYGVGGLVSVADSPFYISITVLGQFLIISKVITLLLTGYGLYVIAILLVYSHKLITRGEAIGYSTMFWLPILYVLDPIIVYLVLSIALPHLAPVLGGSLGHYLGGFSSYPLLIMGSERSIIDVGNESLSLVITSKPTPLYWASLTAPALYIASWAERRNSNSRRSRSVYR